MTETKQCPKCSGAMVQGVLQKTNTFGTSPYVYAPANDSPLSAKGQSNPRHAILVYRCEKCGFVELYAP